MHILMSSCTTLFCLLSDVQKHLKDFEKTVSNQTAKIDDLQKEVCLFCSFY